MSEKGSILRKAIETGFLKPIIEMPGSDNAFIHEISNTFRDTIQVDFSLIDSSIQTHNIDALLLTIHKVRSSLEIFAVPGSTNLCNKIEGSTSISQINDYYTELKRIVNHYLDLLSSELSQVYLIDQKPD